MLEIRNLSKRFGGLQAVSDLSLTLRDNQLLGIIGPNGAGKTTLLNLVTGYLRPSGGSVLLDGEPVTGLPPFRICRLGIARTFQVVRPFNEMSVADNVMTGVLFCGRHDGGMRAARAACEEPLALVGLADKRNVPAGALTLGEKKKLELARALATAPKVLLLDEVMAGLPHHEVEDLMEALERIHANGTAILMIEHLVHVILRLAEHVVVLNFGQKLFEGAPAQVLEHPDVVESYLGRRLEEA